jgi:translation initiation factor 3 subunit B
LTDSEFEPEPRDEEIAVDTACIIVVDGLPVVPASKVDKLKAFLAGKVFGQFGEMLSFEVPLSEDGDKSMGFAFIEFGTADSAKAAIAGTNGVNMDARHKMVVQPFDDIADHLDVPEEFVPPPELTEYEEHADLEDWLVDEAGREQFVVRHDGETEVYATSMQEGGMSLWYGGEDQKEAAGTWTNREAVWSPQGTFLCTFHAAGLKLWGGNRFEECGKFVHRGVIAAFFSPDERYIATWAGVDTALERTAKAADALIVWDVRTQQKLRPLPQLRDDAKVDFAWSHDGAYLARMTKLSNGNDSISIYATPTMTLLGKKSIVAPGAVDLCWSPTENVLAWWSEERGNIPACVTLMEIPSRTAISRKNLVNLEGASMTWHPDGTFLCVRAQLLTPAQKRQKNRLLAKGKSVEPGDDRFRPHTALELFRLKEKNCPVDMVKFEDKPVVDFSWESKGRRFAVIHGTGPVKFTCDIYTMGRGVGKVEVEHSLEEVEADTISWSPEGGVFLMAGFAGNMDGTLVFYDANDKKEIGHQTHEHASGVRWDTSGRVVATIKTQRLHADPDLLPVRERRDNGFRLWSYQGEPLAREEYETCYGFQWRPRPVLALSEEEKEGVRAGMKDIMERLQEADAARERAERLSAKVALRKQLDEFRARMSQLDSWYEGTAEQRKRLGIRTYDDVATEMRTFEQEIVEEEVEEEVSEEELAALMA